jgi:hypothetical protein
MGERKGKEEVRESYGTLSPLSIAFVQKPQITFKFGKTKTDV